MGKPGKPPQKDFHPYTVDTDKTGEVPSINRLLNRKKLLKSSSNPQQPPQSFAPLKLVEPPSPLELQESENFSKAEISGEMDLSAIQMEIPQKETPKPFSSQLKDSKKQMKGQSQANLEEVSEISIQETDISDMQFEISLKPGEAPPALSNNARVSNGKENHQIQKGGRKSQLGPPMKLIQWELKKLKSASDPLGQCLSIVFDSGSHSALFLAITPGPSGSPIPHFVSTAAVDPKERIILWTGLRWDPKIVPELWNQFVKTGFVEFPPPGTMTNVMSNRNVIRGAFGVEQNEWLSLIRIGELSSCRGVVAILSKGSLRSVMNQVLSIVSPQSTLAAQAAAKSKVA